MGFLRQIIQTVLDSVTEKLFKGLRILSGSKGRAAHPGEVATDAFDEKQPNTAPLEGNAQVRDTSKHIGRRADR